VGLLGLLLPLPFPLHDLPATLVFLAVVVVAAQADLSGRPSVLTGRAAVYAGELSFAFYLVHELVILNLPRPAVPAAALVVAVLAVSVACAAALHHAVEVPVRRAMLRAGPTSSR
jgi:peptidoglycan/LPS O-acetylase OafA/YrhL